MNLETYYTTFRIKEMQDPARLERVRQRHDARPASSHRPHVVTQVRMLLSQTRTWLRGVPPVVTTGQ